MRVFLTAVLFILTVAGCNSIQTPASTVDLHVRAAKSGNADELRSTYISKTEKFLKSNPRAWEKTWKAVLSQYADSVVEITGEEIKGESAVVSLRISIPGQAVQRAFKMRLVRENGAWKIFLDFERDALKKAKGACAYIFKGSEAYRKKYSQYPPDLTALARLGVIDRQLASGDWGYFRFIYKRNRTGTAWECRVSPKKGSPTEAHMLLDSTGALRWAKGRPATSADPAISGWLQIRPAIGSTR
jgi:hypothetical protein